MLINKGSRHSAGAFALLLILMGQGGQVVEFPLLGIELSVADTALGLDLAHGQQGALGQGGAHQLIDSTAKSTTFRARAPSGREAAVIAMPRATPAWGSKVMPR